MEESGETFQMHRLIQLATRRWLEDQNSYQYFSETALHILTLAYPIDIPRDWKICQALEPHAESVHERAYQSKMSRLDHARLSLSRSKFFNFQASYSNAEAMARIAIEEHVDIGERDSVDYFDAFPSLFRVYIGRGAYAKAESEILPVLDQAKLIPGEGHDIYIVLLRVKAQICSEQGRRSEGVDILRVALDLARTSFGDQGSVTIGCSSDLAIRLWRLDRLDEAEELCISVLETRKRTLGESHPHTLSDMQTLANIYSSQGRLKEAEMMDQHILQLFLGILGDKHEDTLIAKFNLACSLEEQGRLEEAEALKVDVLSAETELLGANHPSTIHTMASLAGNYMQHEKYNKVLGLMTKAVHLSDDVLGSNHSNTQERRQELIEWYSELNREDATRHHVLEGEEQAKALLKERYSLSLSRCLFNIYFQRACQIQARAESGENGTAKQLLLSKELVAALRLWVANDSIYGIRTIGKILGLMRRDADAQVAFEGLIERGLTSEESSTYSSRSEASSDTHDFPAERSPESSKDDMGAADVEFVHGQRNRQDPHEVDGEAEIVSGIGSLANADSQNVLQGHLSESSSDVSNGSVCEHTEDVDESGGAVKHFEENKSSVSSAHKSNVWENTVWRDSASCDGCEKAFLLPSTRYFCIGCGYIDLCEACYDKLQLEGTLESNEMKECKDHKFLAAPRPEWYDLPWGVVSADGTALIEWAENLLAEFTE